MAHRELVSGCDFVRSDIEDRDSIHLGSIREDKELSLLGAFYSLDPRLDIDRSTIDGARSAASGSKCVNI
jgi:hypothetical protein